jgi:DNA-binding CsgD family transcriptional regulator
MSEEMRVTKVAFDPEAAIAAGRHLFMCRHTGGRRDRSLEELTASHDFDLQLQDEYGVRWLSYFIDRGSGSSFCLAEAPSKEVVEACHRAAHGEMLPYRVIEVEWDQIELFLGDIAEPAAGQHWEAPALRTILAVELTDWEMLALSLGDDLAARTAHAFESLVRDEIRTAHGTEIRGEPGRTLASFGSATAAVRCALAIQAAAGRDVRSQPVALEVRAGVNAGEPVPEDGGLFGAAVMLAKVVASSAGAGEVLVSGVVRDLCAGKGFEFEDRGAHQVPGLEAVRLYALRRPIVAEVRRALPGGLSEREGEVLQLIAAGKSNQQIADALVISLNTVARHVAHILDKTGAANRTEAAAYAYRERLT